jgi:hypothetical protein
VILDHVGQVFDRALGANPESLAAKVAIGLREIVGGAAARVALARGSNLHESPRESSNNFRQISSNPHTVAEGMFCSKT